MDQNLNPQISTVSEVNQQTKETKNNKFIYIVITLVITIFIGVFGFILISNQKEKTFTETPQPTISEIQEAQPTFVESQLQSETASNEIELTIFEPQEGAIVANSKVTLKGKTIPSAEIFINDKELVADKQGNFTTTIDLEEGENIISVVATSPEGSVASRELTVTYNIED